MGPYKTDLLPYHEPFRDSHQNPLGGPFARSEPAWIASQARCLMSSAYASFTPSLVLTLPFALDTKRQTLKRPGWRTIFTLWLNQRQILQACPTGIAFRLWPLLPWAWILRENVGKRIYFGVSPDTAGRLLVQWGSVLRCSIIIGDWKLWGFLGGEAHLGLGLAKRTRFLLRATDAWLKITLSTFDVDY